MRHKKFKLIALLLLGFGSMGLYGQTTETFTDSRDSKIYKTVKIGEQVWMAENLAYKPISGNYWAYDNKADNIVVYGYLYDWETAKKVCPTGWHLPSDAEWTQLTDNLGGASAAGGKLKATRHWNSPNTGATNETGFTALPGGSRSYSTFSGIGSNGYWWSVTEDSFFGPWSRLVYHDSKGVGRLDNGKEMGFSVRCLMD
jgi:uncharacterized protein (TIGR02145 family)